MIVQVQVRESRDRKHFRIYLSLSYGINSFFYLHFLLCDFFYFQEYFDYNLLLLKKQVKLSHVLKCISR